MKKNEKEGFFCVVYFTAEKKTTYYRKTWNPAKLANYLTLQGKNWKWIKIYIDKQEYHSNTEANNYYKIFDETNPVYSFTFAPFRKKIN